MVHVVLIIVWVVHLYSVALFVVFGVVSVTTIVISLASVFVLVLLLFHLFLIYTETVTTEKSGDKNYLPDLNRKVKVKDASC